MKKIKEKINNLSTKQILLISTPISVAVFIVMSITCVKWLDLFSGIVVGLIVGIAVQLLIAECICNYSLKSCQEKIKRKLEKTLNYDEYKEIYLRFSNEYMHLSIDESKVKYYAKLHEKDVEVMINCEDLTKYMHLGFIEFNRIFSTILKSNIL